MASTARTTVGRRLDGFPLSRGRCTTFDPDDTALTLPLASTTAARSPASPPPSRPRR